jgi:hypothetical protein
MTKWKLDVGRGVTWTTSGHGSHQRIGEIVAHIPAGVPVETVLSDARVALGALRISKVDRYMVRVPRLNKRGVPVQSKIKTPTKVMLESQCG